MAQKFITSNPSVLSGTSAVDTQIIIKEITDKTEFSLEVITGDVKFHSGYEVNSDSAEYSENQKLILTAGNGMGDGRIHFSSESAYSFRISW
jgi:hypothetical protein